MASDPYKYFRIEARELLEGLTKGVLELEKGGSEKELFGRLFRFAHTLKGAARVVRLPKIAEQAHALEDVLAPFRAGQTLVPKERIETLLRLLDAISADLTSIDQPVATAATPAAPVAVAPAEELLETVRVDIAEVDQLLEAVTEAAVQAHALVRDRAALERGQHLASVLVEQLSPRRAAELTGSGATLALARVHSIAEELRDTLGRVQRNMSSGVEQVSAELVQVRDAANRLRLLPASSIFPSLERAARDAAHSLQKTMTFHVSGGESRLDGYVLTGIRDALLHAVRNAAAHGIESESERVRAGKSPAGRVELSVERRGSRVAFLCRDDGRGIDVDALRQVAIRRGLLSPSEASALDSDGVIQLILNGGLSTTGTVTEVSGRGVGLDVVRATAARLKGEVNVRSEPGRGTTIEIAVPVYLSSLSALIVDALGIPAAVPLDSVHRTVRLRDADISRAADMDSIVHEGNVIPFAPLARVLRKEGAAASEKRLWSALIVGAEGNLAAIGVDRLLGTATVVVRALPAQSDIDPVVVGASLDAEGNPQLVLDPAALVRSAREGRGPRAESASTSRRPVLIIDDSLTTRMLEQSILESAGYEVELAISAEEGLEKATARRYGLFLVDVEMPGMDGFEFVARTRADPVLRETPAILVTSRGSPEDRKRGHAAGAHAYVVKGEFDQGHLLQTIRLLLG